jgi:hypothetical protein
LSTSHCPLLTRCTEAEAQFLGLLQEHEVQLEEDLPLGAAFRLLPSLPV